jgi:hypothetical protein
MVGQCRLLAHLLPFVRLLGRRQTFIPSMAMFEQAGDFRPCQLTIARDYVGWCSLLGVLSDIGKPNN